MPKISENLVPNISQKLLANFIPSTVGGTDSYKPPGTLLTIQDPGNLAKTNVLERDDVQIKKEQLLTNPVTLTLKQSLSLLSLTYVAFG